MLLKLFKYATYLSLPLVWYKLATMEKEFVRRYMYTKGRQLSEKFKLFPSWDKYAEPFLIRQFSIIFTGGHAFIEGMVEDNDDQDKVEEDLNELKNDIENELNN